MGRVETLEFTELNLGRTAAYSLLACDSMNYVTITDVSEDWGSCFIYPEDGSSMFLESAGKVYQLTSCHIQKDRNLRSPPWNLEFHM